MSGVGGVKVYRLRTGDVFTVSYKNLNDIFPSEQFVFLGTEEIRLSWKIAVKIPFFKRRWVIRIKQPYKTHFYMIRFEGKTSEVTCTPATITTSYTPADIRPQGETEV